ncbi:MAG: hypothetical protein OEV06_07150 [Anaerolineae bacterium]|nr:hypothetical protein [Anaerolineae bacterium]
MADAAWIAIHAAQKERKRKQQHAEEEMTQYTSEDLNENWEFKIVRSATNAFRSPDAFAALLEEEALAGWEMVEKLDDGRVRFKRPRDARSKDHRLPPGLDPYRTQFGRPSNARISMLLVGLLFALGLGMGAFLFIGGDAPIFTAVTVLVPVLIVLIGIGAVVAARRR